MESIVIILLGNKHCGKSTVGKILSKRKKINFFDLDDLIFEQISDQYPSIRKFCQEEGMDAFRKMEFQTVRQFCKRMSEESKNYILALGGGTGENQEVVSIVKKAGKIVYLYAEADTLYQRIKRGGIPPFLNKDNPEEDFRRLFKTRHTTYQAIADITIETTDKNQEEVADSVASAFKP